MASVVVSDVVTDWHAHPYSMVDGADHESGSSSNSSNNSSSSTSQHAYSQNRLASTSTIPASSQSSASSASERPDHRPATQPPPFSRPISIPQTSWRAANESGSVDPFAQGGHRPPRHDFDAAQAYQQLQAQRNQQATPTPHTATAATAVARGSHQSSHRNSMSSSQHSAHLSQSSAPPTSPPSPQLLPTVRSSISMSGNTSPARIKVRDLNHIQSFASEEILARSSRNLSARNLRGAATRADEGGGGSGGIIPIQKYDIAQMPVSDIIEMVAGLLTKITSTNDKAHERDVHRHIPSLQDAAAAAAAGVNTPAPPTRPQSSHRPSTAPSSAGLGGGQHQQQQHQQQQYVDVKGMHRQTQSVLSFHGKNVPSISILMYLSRIHKYCPTTYEVFLSLLVYFDRMTENINKGVVHSFQNLDPADEAGPAGGGNPRPWSRAGNGGARPQTDGMLAESEDQGPGEKTVGVDDMTNASQPAVLMHPFVVDSFNIHRLIMAGVTCASKFFSDVFYTNSRYAKVGGLPLHELNHLELQFLLLNDFKLFIPVDELERYGSLLVEFYAEEILTQQIREKQEREDRERKERGERHGNGDVSGEDMSDDGVQMKQD